MRLWMLYGAAVVGLAGCALPFAGSGQQVTSADTVVPVEAEAEAEAAAASVEVVADAPEAAPEITEGNEIALAAALQVPPKEPGVLGRLFGRKDPAAPADLVIGRAPDDVRVAAVVETPEGTDEVVAVAVAEAVSQEEVVVAASAPAPRQGLRGLFRRARATAADPAAGDDDTAAVADVTDAPATEGVIETVAVETVAVEPEKDTPVVDRPRRGLFGPRRATAPVAAEVSPEATEGPAVFGSFRTACGLSNRALGKKVDQAAGFKLYDSDPAALTPRAFYVTGFADRCAREFIGSVALFGTIQVYELVHFGGGAPNPEVGLTGAAYRKIRQRSCGAARKGVCSASGTQSLARNTAWLNVYGQKGRSTYHEVLLSRGKVVADIVK